MREEEREVDLREYVNIIIKRKKTVLTTFFVLVIATSIINFIAPKIYEISMIIETGNSGISTRKSAVSSMEHIKSKIEIGFFDRDIISALNLDSAGIELNFEVSQPRNTEFIIITTRQKHKDRSAGIKILDQLFNELSKNDERILGSERKFIERRILVISNTIEQATGYLDKLKTQFGGLAKEETLVEIIKMQIEINNLKIEEEKLNFTLKNMYNIKLVQKPSTSARPIKPKIKQNVFMAAFISLFFGIFLAFFIEYWKT